MTVFGIWLIVAIYAIAHDQYIVTIAPEHFTVYHTNPHGIENSRLLAAWSAVLASVSPGLLLGITTWMITRAGPLHKLSLATIFKWMLVLVVTTELAGTLIGLFSYVSGTFVFPRAWYPDDSRNMITTQSIQLTCYGVAFIGSGIMLYQYRQLRLKLSIQTKCKRDRHSTARGTQRQLQH